MRRLRLLFCLSVFCAPAVFASGVTVEVLPALAPNAFGSPSWTGWEANALSALESGASSAGTPGTPTFYQPLSGSVDASATIVTGFYSWLGVADPAAPFDQESGNRMTFGLAIEGNGTQFSISELGFDAIGNDSGDLLGQGFGGVGNGYGPGGYDYSANYVGVIFGKGGNPDTYITSGPDTQLVDALFSRGSGNSQAAYCAGCSTADEQAAIAAAVAGMGGMTQFTGTYYLSANGDESGTFASGSGTFYLSGTPEPSTFVLLLAGVGGLLMSRRFALRAGRG